MSRALRVIALALSGAGLAAGLTAAGLPVISGAQAADRALIYTGNGGYVHPSYLFTSLRSNLVSGGAAGVDFTSVWPSNLSNYAQVYLVAPALAFSATQISDLTTLAADGGLVVMIGDNGTGFSVAAANLNSLASLLGSSARLNGASIDSGCAYAGRVAAAAHPFMGGVGSLQYAYANTVTPNGATGLLQRAGSADYLMAYESGVLLAGDINLFDGCLPTPADSQQFFQNLWNRWCDYDGDGVDREICGGTDCDDEDPAVTSGGAWYRDGDSDGYGDVNSPGASCAPAAGYVADATDCDDTSALVHPGLSEVCDSVDNDCDGRADEGLATNTWYIDGDGDGFGHPSITSTGCSSSAPVGYAQTSTDCDDANSGVHPGANEVCDGVDEDCDGAIDDNPTNGSLWYADGDSDGYGALISSWSACTQPAGYVNNSFDCDDARSGVYPGAPEYCNSLDDDCDGQTDETGVDAAVYWRDADQDGYGNPSLSRTACAAPPGYVADDTDCNDGSAAINAGASESCNGVDDDCDGAIDDSAVDGSTWYLDADADGYGNPARSILSCTLIPGYVADGTDCSDLNSVIHPGASEVCNGIDDDCDGAVDLAPGGAPATDAADWYLDADSDGYGDGAISQESCAQPPGYVASPDDCDDADRLISPVATEQCNGIDDDCDGLIDDHADTATLWYADADADGYGDPASTVDACELPAGYTDDSADCDDADPLSWPGAAEIPYDGTDQDCDGADLSDVDGDGWSAEVAGGLDCLDTDAAIYPGAAEIPEGIDGDCDGTVDEGTTAWDDDGDGYTEEAGDCDDAQPGVYGTAPEAADLIDNDCDGLIDEGTALYDDDGDGQTDQGGDCNDNDAAVSGLSAEVFGNGVDDDCDGVVDSGEVDQDGDGYTGLGGDCLPDDGASWPGADEVPDGVDNDCDGQTDEGTDASDDDGDGMSEAEGDCNDADSTVNPGAAEVADGVDQDCNDLVDEGTDASDDDGDGYTEEAGDCADGDASRYPGADELADGLDQDCDGQTDEGTSDMDGDGYTVEAGDCDDGDGWANPAVNEVCDSIDNNCDGEVDEDCGGAVEDSGVKDPDVKGCSTGFAPDAGGSGLALLLACAALPALRRRGR